MLNAVRLKEDIVRLRRAGLKARLHVGAIMVLPTLLLMGCGSKAPAVDDRVPVKTVVVGMSDSNEQTTDDSPGYAGTIASSFESDLAFRVPGRIVARRARLGERVSAGSPLATLDPEPFRIAARSTEASVAAARAELSKAESEFARNAPLGADRIVAPAQIDRLRAQRDGARARLLDVQAQAAAARDDLGYATLRSPTNGVVTQVSAEAGQYLAAGQVMFRVARPEALDALADVPESVVAGLRTGMPATVTLTSSRGTVAGRIREVSPAADPATRTYRVKVALGASNGARIGMTARVSFPAAAATGNASKAARAVFTLPLTAITQSGKQPAVWVLKPNGGLELRPVNLGTYTESGVTITSGVRAGERVVSAGAHRLDARQRVKPWDGRLP